jgi:hypothetical protein
MPSRRFPWPGRSHGCTADAGSSMRMAWPWRRSMASLTVIAPPLTARSLKTSACIAKLISCLPKLVELEVNRNKGRSRRKPQPLCSKPVTIGDLIREGKRWRSTAAVAGRSDTSSPTRNPPPAQEKCRRRRWTGISSAASAVPGIAWPITPIWARPDARASPLLS